jgi:hypothetical protein
MPALTIENSLGLLAGAGLLLWGLWLWQRRQRLLHNGQLTTGTVIGHDDGPIIRFYTHKQELITAKPSASPSRRHHLDGASINVYYSPENPRDFVLDTTEHKVLPLLFIIMGIVFLIGGLSAE